MNDAVRGRLRSISTPEYVGLLGAGTAIVGSLLPWIVRTSGSRLGVEVPDGQLTLVIGVGIVAFLLTRPFHRGVLGVSGLICATISFFGIVSRFTLTVAGVSLMRSTVGSGIGIYLTFVGGVLMFFSAELHDRLARRRRAAAAESAGQ